jgi:hypothetical protein
MRRALSFPGQADVALFIELRRLIRCRSMPIRRGQLRRDDIRTPSYDVPGTLMRRSAQR